ncbi:MAG: hypothetical protein AB7N73_15790 [Gemmatimonadales bacterium]
MARPGTMWRVRTRGKWTERWGARRGDFIVDTAPDEPGVPDERRYLLVRPLGKGAATGALLHEIADGNLEQVESMDEPGVIPLRVVRAEGA